MRKKTPPSYGLPGGPWKRVPATTKTHTGHKLRGAPPSFPSAGDKTTRKKKRSKKGTDGLLHRAKGPNAPRKRRRDWSARRWKDETRKRTHTPKILRGPTNHDRCLPCKHVVAERACTAVGWRILCQIFKFLGNSFQCLGGTAHKKSSEDRVVHALPPRNFDPHQREVPTAISARKSCVGGTWTINVWWRRKTHVPYWGWMLRKSNADVQNLARTA